MGKRNEISLRRRHVEDKELGYKKKEHYLYMICFLVGLSKNEKDNMHGKILYVLESQKTRGDISTSEFIQYQVHAISIVQGNEFIPSISYVRQCLQQLIKIGFVEKHKNGYRIFENDTLLNAYNTNTLKKIEEIVTTHRKVLTKYNEKYEYSLSFKKFYDNNKKW